MPLNSAYTSASTGSGVSSTRSNWKNGSQLCDCQSKQITCRAAIQRPIVVIEANSVRPALWSNASISAVRTSPPVLR